MDARGRWRSPDADTMAQVVVEYGLSSARASSVYAPGALRADQEGWVAQARRPSLDATAGWTARARGYGLRADELVPHENENTDNHNSPDPKHGSDQRATAALRTPFVQGVNDDRHARREGNAGGDPHDGCPDCVDKDLRHELSARATRPSQAARGRVKHLEQEHRDERYDDDHNLPVTVLSPEGSPPPKPRRAGRVLGHAQPYFKATAGSWTS